MSNLLIRFRVLGFASVLWILGGSVAEAGLLMAGGILTNEFDGTDRFLRRYSFDGQMTDELQLTFDDVYGPGFSMAVVGSRVFVATGGFGGLNGGRNILEVDTNSGLASFAFAHGGALDPTPRLTAIGSNLLISTKQSGTANLQEYTAAGAFVGFYAVPDVFPYRNAEDVAYANGEISLWGNANTGADPIGFFEAKQDLELDRSFTPPISASLFDIDEMSGDLWIMQGRRNFLRGREGEGFEGRFLSRSNVQGFAVLTTAVPEPGTFTLLLSGLPFVAVVLWRRSARRA